MKTARIGQQVKFKVGRGTFKGKVSKFATAARDGTRIAIITREGSKKKYSRAFGSLRAA
jgi:hypothetical protein